MDINSICETSKVVKILEEWMKEDETVDIVNKMERQEYHRIRHMRREQQ